VRLSVAIITFNEETNIKDCLDSVNLLADEIIVLDSFSSDRTEELSRSFSKVKFYQRKFDGHINQKNEALLLCTGDWVLCIDADERVSDTLSESIINFLSNPGSFVGAKFPRLSKHMNRWIKHSGWYPNARFRLVKRGFAKWGGENPHDTILLDGEGVLISGDLLHYSYKDISHQVDTLNKFSSITAFTRFKKEKKSSWLRFLFKPWVKFFEVYLLKRGFMDGVPGFVIAVSLSYYAFLREAKLIEMQFLEDKRQSNLPKYYE